MIEPEPDLPAAVQAELRAMEGLSDDALWTIARSRGNAEMTVDEADRLMLRKAHAFVLLQRRGYRLPSLDELRASQRDIVA